MDFFDNIGKKLTKAGQAVAQKTKDVTGIAKLNSAIYDEEKKINNTYTEIGKLFVKKNADTSEPDFAALIGLIKESEDLIRSYRGQILEIKGVVRCEKCGAEVTNGSAFCTFCGNAVPVRTKKDNDAENDGKSVCRVCGVELEEGAHFCTACGAPTGESKSE